MEAMDLDSPPSSTSFPLFSQLPPELRLRIWNLTRPGSRIVPIRCGSKSPSLSHADTIATSCTTTISPPASLHACVEARQEISKFYQNCLGFGRAFGQVIFNPESDVLYFGPREGYMAAEAQFQTCMSMCSPYELASIRRIAVSDALFWVDNTYRSMTACSLTVSVLHQIATRMTGIDEILFVLREQDTLAGPETTAGIQQRLRLQIMVALQTICLEHPTWRPPCWNVITPEQLASING